MQNSSLTDLDELILMCRDEKARSYISESVASYRAGAYRAAIVGAWIAVCFDLIDKLRELSLAGDKEAEQLSTTLEKIRASGEVSNALKFEKELLEIARDRFELISHLEYIDLARLQADRNRCAHPSLASEDQIYAPSPELARAHIHASVHHLLQHPPVQGKHALDRLMSEFDSEFFPTSKKRILAIYTAGPLRKPRDSLVRNYALVLLKRVLNSDPAKELSTIYKARTVLSAVYEMHRFHVENIFREKLSAIIREKGDLQLGNSIRFLEEFPGAWEFLGIDIRYKLEEFTKKLPTDSFIDLDFLLQFKPLKSASEYRVKSASIEDLQSEIFFITPPLIIERGIELYLSSRSFDKANEGAKFLSDCASELSKNQIIHILSSVGKNREITGSFGLEGLIKKLRSGKVAKEEFEELLKNNGLIKYIETSTEPQPDDEPF